MTDRPRPSTTDGRDMPRAQIVVMAKYPVAGAVKTRLAASIGAEAACRLQRAFVLDLAARLSGVDFPVTWAFWPPDAPFAGLVAPSPCMPQVEGDLGVRLHAAMHACVEQRPLPVLAIGIDSPHLDLRHLHEAADALGEGVPVVLGPAVDGGYYLIGLRTPEPSLFMGIPWGTPAVLEATLRRARERALEVRLLPATFDVDDAGGLSALRRVLDEGTVQLPHTSAALHAFTACE